MEVPVDGWREPDLSFGEVVDLLDVADLSLPDVARSPDLWAIPSVPVFAKPATYQAAGQVLDLVTADFNGDGTPDLAVTSFTTNSIFVLLGNGDGTFLPAIQTDVGGNAWELASGDLDRDGRADLVVLTSGKMVVLLGEGDGHFTMKGVYTQGVGIRGVVVADVDRDFNPDVVAGSNGAVSIHLGVGDGTLQDPYALPCGQSVAGIVARDIDGDKWIDLIASSIASAQVCLFIGTGQGQFAPVQRVDVGLSTRQTTVADLNGDLRLDLATADALSGPPSTVSVVLATGRDTFAAATHVSTGKRPISIASADFNRDRHADLVTADYDAAAVSVVRGFGNGTFAPTVPDTSITRMMPMGGLDARVVGSAGARRRTIRSRSWP